MDARTWQHRHLEIGDPDPFMAARLKLTDRWMDEWGRWQRFENLHQQKLWMLLVYLRAHAPELMAQDRRCATKDPDAWLASRPFVRALDAELADRGEIAPGEALSALRALGLAPWERGVS